MCFYASCLDVLVLYCCRMFYVLLFCLVNATAQKKQEKKVLLCANNLAIKNFQILTQSFLIPAIFYVVSLLLF